MFHPLLYLLCLLLSLNLLHYILDQPLPSLSEWSAVISFYFFPFSYLLLFFSPGQQNANSRRMTKSVSDTALCLRSEKPTKHQYSKRTKTSTFYLDQSNKKGFYIPLATSLGYMLYIIMSIPMYTGILDEPFGSNTRKSPRKTNKEEFVSSAEVSTRTMSRRADIIHSTVYTHVILCAVALQIWSEQLGTQF